MGDGQLLAFVARQESLALLSDDALVLPVRPGLSVPRMRTMAERPEALLRPEDLGEIEAAVARVVADWSADAAVRDALTWRDVHLVECFSYELDFVVRDLVKTAWIIDRALAESDSEAVATDVPPLAGPFPSYPYLAGLGTLLENHAQASSLPIRLLSASGEARAKAPRRWLWRAYGSVAARQAVVRLRQERPLLAIGPHPEFYGPLAQAWKAHGGSTVVATPAATPIRASSRKGLFVLPFEGLLSPSDRSEAKSFAASALAALRSGPLGGPLVQRGIDLAAPFRRHVLARLEGTLPLLAAIGIGFERGLDRAAHVVLAETGSPASKAVVRCARLRGIPVTVLQHGVLAGAFSARQTEADRVAAWGPADAVGFRTALPAGVRVEPTGCPRYDELAEEVRGRPGRPFNHSPVVLYVSQPFVQDRPARSPWDRAEALEMAVELTRRSADYRLLVKWHPSEAPERLPTPELDESARASHRSKTFGLLRLADVVLGISSTVTLEAMLLGRPVIFLGPPDPESPFSPPEKGGGLRAVNADALAAHLRALRTDKAFRARVLEGQKAYLRRFMPLDGRAAKRVARFLMEP